MSHVVDLKLEVNSLEALEAAAKMIGLELVQGKTTYRWFGRWVGDYPMPEGFTKQDLGKCDHVLRIPGNNTAYEVGVCKNKNGKPGYSLLWDFWAGGYGLQEKIGDGGGLLKQAYTMTRSEIELKKKGYRTMMQKKKNGTLRLETY